MKRNKNGAMGRKPMKALILTLSIVLLLYAVVGGTLAYVVMKTASVNNEFDEAYVDCTVNSNFSVTNNGNVDAYIRAAIVVNWANSSGDVYGLTPKYSISINASSDWNDGTPWYLDPSTGFYYYKSNVAPSGGTSALVTGFSANESAPDDDYFLHVEVVAEAIQAEGYGSNGKLAVENAWGVTFYGK